MLNNRRVLAYAVKRSVKIERLFCPHGHRNMMMQATPQQSLCWECSTCITTSGLSLDGCDVRFVDRGEFRGCRREHGSLKVQGQLKDEDQGISLHLIYETEHLPESQITPIGLVPGQKVESGKQVTESFNIPEGFFNRMVLESQPTKPVPRRVRLAIERNIDEICLNRIPQSRRQRGNQEMRSVGTTRPLRGVALFDGTRDLTDEDAQEATFRACRSVDPGTIIVGIPRTASKSHFEFCTTLCTWQHERGALYILILTDSEGALSEEQFLALEPLHRNEGRAWLGWDLRQVGIGARLDSNIFAMSRARVWTNSFTMAEYIQQEAIAREGPPHSDKLFHLLKNVILATPCSLHRDCTTQLMRSS